MSKPSNTEGNQDAELAGSDLLWLKDAPHYTDDQQVSDFFDSVAQPRLVQESMSVDLSREALKTVSTKVGGQADTGGMLKAVSG